MILALICPCVCPCVSRTYSSRTENSPEVRWIGSMLESPRERKFASMGLTGLPSASACWVDAMSFEAISWWVAQSDRD